MDMVDSAFERGDVGLFKPGIDYAIGGKFITLRRKHFAGFCGFFEFQKNNLKSGLSDIAKNMVQNRFMTKRFKMLMNSIA